MTNQLQKIEMAYQNQERLRDHLKKLKRRLQESDAEIRARGEIIAQKGSKLQAEAAENKAKMVQNIAEIKEKIDVLMQFKIECVG